MRETFKFDKTGFMIENHEYALSPERVSVLRRVCKIAAPAVNISIKFKNEYLSGSSVKNGISKLKISVQIEDNNTLVIKRGGKMLEFKNLEDLASFVLLHEVAHLFFPQTSANSEVAADLWAFSMLSDFAGVKVSCR